MSELYGMTLKQKTAMQNNLMAKALSDPRFLFYSGNI